MKMEQSVPAYKDGTDRVFLPMKMEQTECSKTSAFKIQTPGNYLKKTYNKI